MRVSLPDPPHFASLLQDITGVTLNKPPTGIATDSRECLPGDLFVAISGETTDGHNYLAQVNKAGCQIALVTRIDENLGNFIQIQVNDPVHTIGKIAGLWRSLFTAPVVGITGSNGKTSTKDLLAHLLFNSHRVHVTQGNFNTSIGLPLTLLRLTAKHNLSILEMGANQPGDIALLARLAQPTHGIITNVAPAHLEGFGSIEEVARTKGELFQALTHGTAFVNQDDPLVSRIAVPGEKISFGFQPNCDFSAVLDYDDNNNILLIINGRMVVTGSKNIAFAKNILAATAMCITLGENWNSVLNRVISFKAPAGRCSVVELGDITIIDDSYNANLASVSSAIDFLKHYNTSGRHILVFGDMFEQGEASATLHAQVGEKASEACLDAVFMIGNDSTHTASALSGIEFSQHYYNKPELVLDLKEFIKPGDVILVKGSRGMEMETIIAELGKS